MSLKVVALTVVLAGIAMVSTGLAQSGSEGKAVARYLPEYTASGELVLPKNFHEWVYVGSPLTPNALNGGKANFPEFHNVYIEPGSYEIYKKTNVFPEGISPGRGTAPMSRSRIPSATPRPEGGDTTTSITTNRRRRPPN